MTWFVEIGYNCSRPKKSQGPESRHAEVRRRRGSWGREGGDKDKDRGAGCISEQCSASGCTHPAGQQDVWCAQLHHHCSLPLARVLKTNLLVPKKRCLEGSTSEFCFPLISPPPASLCNPPVTCFFLSTNKIMQSIVLQTKHIISPVKSVAPFLGLRALCCTPHPASRSLYQNPLHFWAIIPAAGPPYCG